MTNRMNGVRQALMALVLAGAMMGLRGNAENAFPLTDDWVGQVRAAAPAEGVVKPAAKRKILVMSLATGYKHWVIPHVEQVLKVLGEKSGAFEVTLTTDVGDMTAENLANYDAVVLNNSCSDRAFRDLYRDALVEQWEKQGKLYPELDKDKRIELSAKMQQDLLAYVAGGKGLISIHGGSTTFTKSQPFCDMHGGGFDHHLKQQVLTYLPVDMKHPLMAKVPAEGFTIEDEPYMYNMGYDKKNFRPLLVGDPKSLKTPDKAYEADARYVAWIKAYGKGRVFSVSPSHNGSAYTIPGMLQFYLNGIQYALGDLTCDDSPIGNGK